jgi:hypothetical protein
MNGARHQQEQNALMIAVSLPAAAENDNPQNEKNRT